MKKWKILSESDNQSQKQPNPTHPPTPAKPHRYIPLKRSRQNNLSNLSNTSNLTTSRNIESSKEFHLPIFSERYLKYDGSVSGRSKGDRDRDGREGREGKMKTEFFGDQDLEFGRNFQEIQEKFGGVFGGMRYSQRGGGSMILKRKEQDTIISQRQTQRKFFKNSQPATQIKAIQTPQKTSHPIPLSQSQTHPETQTQTHSPTPTPTPIPTSISIPTANPTHIQNLQHSLQNLTTNHQKLQQQLKQELANFFNLMKENNMKISDKLTEGKVEHFNGKNGRQEKDKKEKEREKAILQIFEEYRVYKPKIDDLDKQKQGYLQALIKMAPV